MSPLQRLRREPPDAPLPPVDLPPGHVVLVPGRGEFFVRDSGGDGPPVLLLHGWMFASDLNWWPVYDALIAQGYRVLAMDHRGHGRGLRGPVSFTLEACADDAAALVDTLGTGPVVAVGYSMGGPVAQLMARRHPASVRALVCCATSTDWRDLYLRVVWRTMSGLRLLLGLFPMGYWKVVLAGAGVLQGAQRTWVASELSRGNARDIAEAGRELGRYDARPWLGELRQPAAIVMTTRDRQVRPKKQRQLAKALRAPVFEVADDHFAVTTSQEAFRQALLAALTEVGQRAAGAPAAAGRAA